MLTKVTETASHSSLVTHFERVSISGAFVYLGPDHRLVAELRAAEVDPTAFVRAQALVEALPALSKRKLLSTFMRVTWPRAPPH